MTKFQRIIILLLSAALVIETGNAEDLFAYESKITVYYDREIGQINKKVFGNSFLGHEPSLNHPGSRPNYGYADAGSGIWDPKRNEPVKGALDLARDSGITVIRFPGGCGAHHYNWKAAIGKERKHFLYGINEFMRTVDEIGAEPIFTISYFTGNEQDAADLVEYLNAPFDGKHYWAGKRAENGHPEPYGVKYFEIGNEIWHGNHREIKRVLPDEYAYRYLKYFNAMKGIDPSINIGVILKKDYGWKEWNKVVLEIVGGNLDFGVLHAYPTPVWGEKLEVMDPIEIFSTSLAIPLFEYEEKIQQILGFLEEKVNRKIPLAITEYNAGIAQEKPVPYRYALGTALINAELLRIFMKPENNILLANHWHFSNEAWGMVKVNYDIGKYFFFKKIDYYKRPNYYVYELYKKHFGDILIETDTKSNSYDIRKYDSDDKKTNLKALISQIKKGSVITENLLNEKWRIVSLAGVNAEEKDGILGIDFIEPENFNYSHSVKYAKIKPNTYYRLSGYIKIEKLTDKRGVCLAVSDARGWKETRSAAHTEQISGTNDWQYIDILYRTLFDAEKVIVSVRRIGKEGTLKGRAYFKDVKLEEYEPATRIPYLSVNASKSWDGNTVFLVVINKNMDEAVRTSIELISFLPSDIVASSPGRDLKRADAWILNGPSIDSTNEIINDNVKIIPKRVKINSNSFEFIFEPHSLTAIEIERTNN